MRRRLGGTGAGGVRRRLPAKADPRSGGFNLVRSSIIEVAFIDRRTILVEVGEFGVGPLLGCNGSTFGDRSDPRAIVATTGHQLKSVGEDPLDRSARAPRIRFVGHRLEALVAVRIPMFPNCRKRWSCSSSCSITVGARSQVDVVDLGQDRAAYSLACRCRTSCQVTGVPGSMQSAARRPRRYSYRQTQPTRPSLTWVPRASVCCCRLGAPERAGALPAERHELPIGDSKHRARSARSPIPAFCFGDRAGSCGPQRAIARACGRRHPGAGVEHPERLAVGHIECRGRCQPSHQPKLTRWLSLHHVRGLARHGVARGVSSPPGHDNPCSSAVIVHARSISRFAYVAVRRERHKAPLPGRLTRDSMTCRGTRMRRPNLIAASSPR
jgi:hypothetical protein